MNRRSRPFSVLHLQILTGKPPFWNVKSSTAVVMAVLGKDVRPAKMPQHSANGNSYEIVWEVAEACWARVPEDRISMFDVLKRLREVPSLVRVQLPVESDP